MTKLTMDQISVMMELEVEDVQEVYSGKPGCACGCRGKYYTNPAYKADADKQRGYEQPAPARNVTMIKKVMKLFKDHSDAVEMADHTIYALDVDNRTYTLYLVPGAVAFYFQFTKGRWPNETNAR